MSKLPQRPQRKIKCVGRRTETDIFPVVGAAPGKVQLPHIFKSVAHHRDIDKPHRLFIGTAIRVPASPVVETATSAPEAALTPRAISSAHSRETAPYRSRVSALIPSSFCLASLE